MEFAGVTASLCAPENRRTMEKQLLLDSSGVSRTVYRPMFQNKDLRFPYYTPHAAHSIQHTPADGNRYHIWLIRQGNMDCVTKVRSILQSVYTAAIR